MTENKVDTVRLQAVWRQPIWDH